MSSGNGLNAHSVEAGQLYNLVHVHTTDTPCTFSQCLSQRLRQTKRKTNFKNKKNKQEGHDGHGVAHLSLPDCDSKI